MLKKIILGVLIGTLSFTFIGCSKEEKPPVQTNDTQSNQSNFVKIEELGFSFLMPKEWEKNENYIDGLVLGASPDSADPFYGGLKLSYIPKENLEKMKSLSTDTNPEKEDEWKELLNTLKPLVHFNIYHKDTIDSNHIENLSGLKYNIFLGEQENLVYYLSYPDPKTIVGLSKTSQKMYDKFYKDISTISETVKIFNPILPRHNEDNVEIMGVFPEFDAMDINHQGVSNSIFKDHPLTMINIWATFCGPCIDEIPDLQKLYSEMKDENINIVGIIGDAQHNEELAQKILSQNKVTYTNIIPNEILQTKFLNTISAYPTSIFVDQQGNIVGEPIIGSRSKEEYKKSIIETLELIKKQNIATP